MLYIQGEEHIAHQEPDSLGCSTHAGGPSEPRSVGYLPATPPSCSLTLGALIGQRQWSFILTFQPACLSVGAAGMAFVIRAMGI